MAVTFVDTYDQLAFTYGDDILNLLPSWMLQNPDLAAAYLNEVIEAGGTSNVDSGKIALEVIRQAPEYRQMYDDIFAGNRRDDGTLRLSESAYFARVQGYRDAITATSLNMNPTIFDDEYAELIAGDVDLNEFQRRVDALYSRVIDNAPAIRDFYAREYGINMTDEGILASLLSRQVGEAVLAKRLTMAEIGGEASMANFNLTTEFVELLVEQGGMNRDEAMQMFGSAQQMLPVLGALAARHGDRDDTFDITEFARAAALNDPTQLSRIQRLQAQESSTFTGGAAVDIVRQRTGGVTGLLDV